MANAFMNMAATTTTEKVVRRAKALCQLPTTSTSGIKFLGSTDTDVLNELADCLNDAISEVLDSCPILNIQSATLTATGGVEYTELPADLRNSDIYGLEWLGGDVYQGRGIQLLSHQHRDKLPEFFKNPMGYVYDPPRYCYVEWGTATARLYWLPAPGIDRQFTILYRALPVKYTSDDVDVEGTKPTPLVVPIPDDMIELLALKMAEKIAYRNGGSDGVQWQVLEAKYEAKLTKIADRLAGSPLATRMAQMRFAGTPGSFVESTQQYEASN